MPSILDEIALTPKPIGNGPEFHLKREGDRFTRADGSPLRVNETKYVTDNGGDIQSITGELIWKSRQGALLIQALRLQGLVGMAGGNAVNLGAVSLAIAPAPPRKLPTRKAKTKAGAGGRFVVEACGGRRDVYPASQRRLRARSVRPTESRSKTDEWKQTFHLDNPHRTTWLEVVR